MAKNGATIRIKMNRLPEAQANLGPAMDDAIEKYINEVESIAAGIVPVDTGKLKNSTEKSKGRIAWTAEYAGYVNFGTRYMAAQPFATDASEKAIPQLKSALNEIEGKLL